MADRDLEKSIEWVNPHATEDSLRARLAFERADAWAKMTTFVPYDDWLAAVDAAGGRELEVD